MGSKTKQGERKQRPQAPTGPQVVRSLWIVNLGTQENTFKGVTKSREEIMFTFEMVNAPGFVFKEENGEEPFVLSMFAFGKTLDGFGDRKSKLNSFVDSWRSREMTDAEKKEGLDFEKFLDKPALATVISVTDKKDPKIKYSNIQSITKLPVEMKTLAKPLKNKPVYFEIDAIDFKGPNGEKLNKNEAGMTQFQAFELLPKFIQDKIAKSPEWQAQVKKHSYYNTQQTSEVAKGTPEEEEVMHQPDADF